MLCEKKVKAFLVFCIHRPSSPELQIYAPSSADLDDESAYVCAFRHKHRLPVLNCALSSSPHPGMPPCVPHGASAAQCPDCTSLENHRPFTSVRCLTPKWGHPYLILSGEFRSLRSTGQNRAAFQACFAARLPTESRDFTVMFSDRNELKFSLKELSALHGPFEGYTVDVFEVTAHRYAVGYPRYAYETVS